MQTVDRNDTFTRQGKCSQSPRHVNYKTYSTEDELSDVALLELCDDTTLSESELVVGCNIGRVASRSSIIGSSMFVVCRSLAIGAKWKTAIGQTPRKRKSGKD